MYYETDQTSLKAILENYTFHHFNYCFFIERLQVMDRKAYAALSKVYTSAIGKLYERDIRHFLEEAKVYVSGPIGMHCFC